MRFFGRFLRFCILALCFSSAACPSSRGQAALLLEQPYALSRITNPTGHVAVYFARVCAATPIRLRRCAPGELGAVIARYNGIGGYDWLAVPLLPYLYAVEDPGEVPARADRAKVRQLRRQYHDRRLAMLAKHLAEGGLIRRGWDQLAGASYNRRIYALRFATTPEQDDRFIAWMNGRRNRSDFHILWSNCADFAGGLLDFYFPGVFARRILPDAGIVTPRQLAYRLQNYARRHPELKPAVFVIPQIPGNRRASTQDKSVVESLIVSGDIAPVAVLAPYVAAGIGVDFLIWGRYPLDMKHAQVLGPRVLALLNGREAVLQPR